MKILNCIILKENFASSVFLSKEVTKKRLVLLSESLHFIHRAILSTAEVQHICFSIFFSLLSSSREILSSSQELNGHQTIMWLINLSDSTARNQEYFMLSAATSSKSMCMSEETDLKSSQERTEIPLWMFMKHIHIIGFSSITFH